jgi:hypothetical protein
MTKPDRERIFGLAAQPRSPQSENARAFGLTVPAMLLARAGEVVE